MAVSEGSGEEGSLFYVVVVVVVVVVVLEKVRSTLSLLYPRQILNFDNYQLGVRPTWLY